jgi:death-on-curing protein
MPKINWIEYDEVLALHQYTIATHGGYEGIRSEDVLSSGLNKPRTYCFYLGIEDLYLLASLYAQGIAGNHPFVDGNERTSFLVADYFLCKNNIIQNLDNHKLVSMSLALIQKDIDYNKYADFLRSG